MRYITRNACKAISPPRSIGTKSSFAPIASLTLVIATPASIAVRKPGKTNPASLAHALTASPASTAATMSSSTCMIVAPHRAGLPFARFKHDPNSPTHVCFDGRAEQLRWRQHLVEIVQGRTNALQERSDPATIASAVEFLGDSGLHRPAALMPQDYKQRCVQVCAGVPQRPRDQEAENVSSTRMTNSSPNPASNKSSGGTRLSLHPRIVA